MKQISSIVAVFAMFGLLFGVVSQDIPYVFADVPGDIALSAPKITDSFGHQLSEISLLQHVQIVSDVTNKHHATQDVAFVVTVTDDAGQSTRPQWITMSLNPNQTLSPGLPWTPQNDGMYDIRIEVWDDPINKNVLGSSEFSVHTTESKTNMGQSASSVPSPHHHPSDEAAFKDITCSSDRLLVLRDNGNFACVSEKTAEKMADRFGWKIVSDEIPTPKTKYSINADNLALTEPKITDSFGKELTQIMLNKQIQIVVDITNKNNSSQDFAYAVTIIDEYNNTVDDKWFTATLEPHQTFTGSLSWIPENYGDYLVYAIVSDNPSKKSISDVQTIPVAVEEID